MNSIEKQLGGEMFPITKIDTQSFDCSWIREIRHDDIPHTILFNNKRENAE